MQGESSLLKLSDSPKEDLPQLGLRGLLQFGREVNDLAAQALWDPARLLLVGRRNVEFDHFRHVRSSLSAGCFDRSACALWSRLLLPAFFLVL